MVCRVCLYGQVKLIIKKACCKSAYIKQGQILQTIKMICQTFDYILYKQIQQIIKVLSTDIPTDVESNHRLYITIIDGLTNER